ncbi:FACT complex subunit SSRP1-B-like [Panicum miliaceum]|uniref:FACT complex subunit SSRP1 n=1 Tax=Panicum miliaceum TaxID=4540 RepID=A0A3L6T238_PANMI|nr:FACT complex subunit SSRP1-B-like [Panicum miliaceum]
MTDGHHFNNISLGGRGGFNPGQFKLCSGGLAWKKQGGGKIIEVDKADITSVAWMRIPKSYQLNVGTKEGLFYRFFGFRHQDVNNLSNFIQRSTGISPQEKQLSISGHNWGGVEIDGTRLCFNVGEKQAFEVSIADVSQAQMQGKTDVVLEFHKDLLTDLSFHVPTSNAQFIGDEHRTSAQMLCQEILHRADGGSPSEAAAVTFEGITILTPRGRYSVELHQSFLRLSQNPHTFVVIALDPPIRKGQTLYPHIVIQFVTEAMVERELALSEQILAEKYKDRLQGSYRGQIHEVFSNVLCGLSGAKVTRPSTFRSCQHGYAVKSALKAEDGLLYPLEKAFFFLPKPPTLILYEEIEYELFERLGAAGVNISSQYFDLLVKLKNDQEHLFSNIQRIEYQNLFSFISDKHLKILNPGDGQRRTGGVTAVLESTDDDSVDPHLERIKNQACNEESDEEDEDFVADKDDSGSPSDDSEEEDSDASMRGGEKEDSSKMEASISKPHVKRKLNSGSDEGSQNKKSKRKKEQKSGPDAGSQKKKAKRKKDPNAPSIHNSNPELTTTEIAKKLGERWQKMTAEERQPYVEQSRADKQRYEQESAAYHGAAAQPGPGDGSEGRL